MSVVLFFSLVTGLALGCGLAMVVRGLPIGWRPSLVDRVQPQLAGHVPRSGLMEHPVEGTFGTLRQLLKPALEAGVAQLDRFNLNPITLRKKLDAAGLDIGTPDYRAQQLIYATVGACLAIVLNIVAAVNGVLQPFLGVISIVGMAVLGFMLRDNFLSFQVKRRRQMIIAEFPTVAELFALSVAAGESAVSALERVALTAKGEMAGEFSKVVRDIHAGTTIAKALNDCSARIQIAPVERFISGLCVAIERGTPLAEVLRAQARDVRELAKRELLESAGKKEIGMMAPLIFGIMPLTVVFAVFPGLSLLNFGF